MKLREALQCGAFLSEPAGWQGHAAAARGGQARYPSSLQVSWYWGEDSAPTADIWRGNLNQEPRGMSRTSVCVVVEQGKGRKEISFHPLPWYRLSPTTGFPQVSWFREPREVAVKKLFSLFVPHFSSWALARLARTDGNVWAGQQRCFFFFLLGLACSQSWPGPSQTILGRRDPAQD